MKKTDKKSGWTADGKHYCLPSGAIVEADAHGILYPSRYADTIIAEYEAIVAAEQQA